MKKQKEKETDQIEKFDKFSKGKRNNKKGWNKSKTNVGRKYNDVSWYTKNKTITDAFAKLPFNFIIGGALAGAEIESVNVPSIISYNVDWVASPQCSTKVSTMSTDWKDKNILDLVATILYTKMRRANAGANNGIEHVDVIISNLLASIDIQCNVHYLHRIFKVANSFSWKNRSIPFDIFKDHWNLDYNDFIYNQANYRGWFDKLVALAQTIRTLAGFPFIEAAKAQFSEIFKDSDTDTGREQIIVSAKPFHHIYDPQGTESNPGGMVRLMEARDVVGWKTAYPSGSQIIYTGTVDNSLGTQQPIKVKDLLNILQAQIYALINDSDFNLIQADIEKAFGDQSGYIVIDPIRDVEPLTPVYSGEFMTSFHNGVFYKMPSTYMQIANNTGYAVFRKGTIVNTQYQIHGEGGLVEAAQDFGYWIPDTNHFAQGPVQNLIDLDTDNPSVDDVVIATRFKSIFNHDIKTHIPGDWLQRYPVDNAVTDSAFIMYAAAASNFVTWGGNITSYISSGRGGAKRLTAYWSNAALNYPLELLAVEYHPIGSSGKNAMMNELNNIRYIRESELLPIQEACFLSLWNVPEYTNI